MVLYCRLFVSSQNVLTLTVAAREVTCKLSLLEFLERVQLHLMAGVLVTLTDQSNVSCHVLTHFYSATAGHTLTLREQVDLCHTGQAVTPSAVLGLRRQGLWGLQETRSLNNDPRRKNTIRAHLLGRLCLPPHPTPLHQAARSAADNRIRQQNGADEYPRGPA